MVKHCPKKSLANSHFSAKSQWRLKQSCDIDVLWDLEFPIFSWYSLFYDKHYVRIMRLLKHITWGQVYMNITTYGLNRPRAYSVKNLWTLRLFGISVCYGVLRFPRKSFWLQLSSFFILEWKASLLVFVQTNVY